MDNVPWNFRCIGISIVGVEHHEYADDVAHASAREAPHELVTRAGYEGNGFYLGLGPHGPCWTGAQRSALVLGPPRAGKTSSLVIPNLLHTQSPVVSTSTKPDVMLATAPTRNRSGWSFLYDPSGEIECPNGVERVGWSPLTTAANWDRAVQTTAAMVTSSRMVGTAAQHGSGDNHWTERAGALLAPLLHAAALEKIPLRTVLRWIDRHNGTPALEILNSSIGDDATATDLLAGIMSTDAREQSGIWSTASGVLAAYRTEGAMASTALPPLDLTEFCRSSNTMYICSSSLGQQLTAPLVVAAIGDVRDATYRVARHEPQRLPTMLALDEMANIAPIPDLVPMVSEGGSQGLLVLACLQDLSQARTRWGTAADGFLTLFSTTVVLPGIADTRTLRDLSALGGEHDVAVTTIGQSIGRHGRVRPSTSVSTIRLPRYPVDALARGVPRHAHVLTPDNASTSVALTPAHACSPWRELLPPDRIVTRPSLGRER
jgi:type IV secretory pathway TraG/TraD family ATPase VirD4